MITDAVVVAGALIAFTTIYTIWTKMFNKKDWNPRGKHCFITGGSQGTGLELARILTVQGAHVTIVSRNQENLDRALVSLEQLRQTRSQILQAFAYPVNTAAGAEAALEAACETHEGRCPDAQFFMAGASTPGLFVEQDEESLKKGMDQTYWCQAWSALAATKKMVRQEAKGGKLVFVSSVLGYMSIVGYTTYSPGKFAIRGLAEALQSELMLYDIDVHIAFPGTIFSPGYENENKTKPKVTLKIEETDGGSPPEVVAAAILKGVQKGHFHITYDFILNVFRGSTRGSSPGNSYIMDSIYEVIGRIALPFWRSSVDHTVRLHAKEHREYLREQGFFDDEEEDSEE